MSSTLDAWQLSQLPSIFVPVTIMIRSWEHAHTGWESKDITLAHHRLGGGNAKY